MSLALVAVPWAGRGLAVEFPGPVALPQDGASLSALRVLPPGATQESLVSGSGDGFLNLNRYNPTSASFTILHRFFIGGAVVAIEPWLGRSASDPGLVVATANPDRLVFVAVRGSFPYLSVQFELTLEEDPGGLAFVGDASNGPWEMGVSLPGVDEVVFLAESGGVWAVSGTVACGDRPGSVAAIDLDDDGLKELVVAQTGVLSGNLGVFRRQPDGSYALQTVALPGGVPALVAAQDINGDSREELAVAQADAQSVVFYEPSGGTLTEVAQAGLTMQAQSMRLTILPSGESGLFTGSQERGLIEFASFSGGAWLRRDTYYPGCRPVGFAFSDLDADGLDDLIALGGTDEVLTVLLGNESPGYWGFPAVSLVSSPGSFAAEDLDADGWRDLLVADANGTTVSFFAGQPDGSFALAPVIWPLGFIPGRIMAVQVTADLSLEVAILDLIAADVVVMDLDPGTGLTLLSRTPVGPFPFFLAAGDVDGDLRQDLLVLSQSAAETKVLYGTGTGAFDEIVSFGFEGTADRARLLDLNNDGKLDIVATDGMNRVWMRLNTGGRQFGQPTFVNAGSGALHMAVGDLDLDGDDDVVVGNRSERSLSFFENTGSGSLVRRIGSHAVASPPAAVHLGDFDGDGRLDVLVNLPDLDQLSLVFAVDNWIYALPSPFGVSSDVTGLAVADLNLDTTPDILALDRSLLLALSLLNLDRNQVSVAQDAFGASCEDGTTILRVRPDRPGPWTLELDGGLGWVPFMRSGQALIGQADYEDGDWVLRLHAGELALHGLAAVAGWQARLTIGSASTLESQVWPLDLACRGPLETAPTRLAWRQEPWPNPFNPSVQARFSLARAGRVHAAIYDLRGRLVAGIWDGWREAGDHWLAWDGQGAAGPAGAGSYFLRVRTEGGTLATKLVLLK